MPDIIDEQFKDWMERCQKTGGSTNPLYDQSQIQTEMMLYIAMNIHNIDENISLIRDMLAKKFLP